MPAPDSSQPAPADHTETQGDVTWKTALVSLAVVFILGGAALGGLLLAGRDRGLDRADHLLTRLPKEASVVLRIDARALRDDAGLRKALEPLWRAALRGAQPWAVARAAGPLHLFVTSSAGPAVLFSLRPRLPKPPPGTAANVHQGVDLFARGTMVTATLRGGWQAAGPRTLVAAVIESSQRKRARLPARSDFGTFRTIAAAGRRHLLAQLILLGGPILGAMAQRWPAVSEAQGLGFFAMVEDATVEVLVVLAKVDREAALKQLRGLLRRLGPEATRLGASLQVEDHKGLLLLRGRVPRAYLAPLVTAAASWLKDHFPRGNSL